VIGGVLKLLLLLSIVVLSFLGALRTCMFRACLLAFTADENRDGKHRSCSQDLRSLESIRDTYGRFSGSVSSFGNRHVTSSCRRSRKPSTSRTPVRCWNHKNEDPIRIEAVSASVPQIVEGFHLGSTNFFRNIRTMLTRTILQSS
jgi:hypothetical protein